MAGAPLNGPVAVHWPPSTQPMAFGERRWAADKVKMAGLFTLNAAIWWQISLQQLKHLIGVRCLAAASSMRPALFFIQLGHFSHLFRRYFKEIKSAGSGQCRHGNGRLLTLVHRSAERNRTLCFRTGGAACTRRSQRRPHPGLLSQLWAVTSQQQAGNVRHVLIVDAAEGGHFGQTTDGA